jgi:hypothetical protein
MIPLKTYQEMNEGLKRLRKVRSKLKDKRTLKALLKP